VRQNEQEGLSVGRESCRPQGRSRSPGSSPGQALKCWYSFEMLNADAEGFNVHRRPYRSTRFGEGVEIRRSPQAVACKKRYAVELGKPHRVPVERRANMNGIQLPIGTVWET